MKKRIISWIRLKVKQSGAKGIVLGLSGGVDSAVVAALCKEAVGKAKVLTLTLPCHSQKQDLRDAALVAKKLSLAHKVIDLSKTYNDLIRILPDAGRLAQSNLKPRLRMLVLYYYANKLNYLVAGTGNKSELMVGYFTKHGDGATDILPIGNLLKKDVRALACQLGIPERVITKAPTAGLWAGQTDEGEMGLSYCELDDILGRMEKGRKQVAAKQKVSKVKIMIARSAHKRQGPEVCR